MKASKENRGQEGGGRFSGKVDIGVIHIVMKMDVEFSR